MYNRSLRVTSRKKKINEAAEVRKAQGNECKEMNDTCYQVPTEYIYQIFMGITHGVTRTLWTSAKF